VLRQTREQGYGANNQDWGDEGKIAAIARPIMRQDEVVGCLNLVYIAKAMPTEKAAKKYLKKMNDVVLKIEEQL